MATNFFLKLDGIKGDVTAPGHMGDIQVLSWSHSFNQPTSPKRSGSGTVEQANHSDFSFTKYIDGATTEIVKRCWSGRTIPSARLTAYRSDGTNPEKYLTIDFKNVIVSNYSIGGGSGNVPTETITLGYGAVSYTYDVSARSGEVRSGPVKVVHDLVLQSVS